MVQTLGRDDDRIGSYFRQVCFRAVRVSVGKGKKGRAPITEILAVYGRVAFRLEVSIARSIGTHLCCSAGSAGTVVVR